MYFGQWRYYNLGFEIEIQLAGVNAHSEFHIDNIQKYGIFRILSDPEIFGNVTLVKDKKKNWSVDFTRPPLFKNKFRNHFKFEIDLVDRFRTGLKYLMAFLRGYFSRCPHRDVSLPYVFFCFSRP